MSTGSIFFLVHPFRSPASLSHTLIVSNELQQIPFWVETLRHHKTPDSMMFFTLTASAPSRRLPILAMIGSTSLNKPPSSVSTEKVTLVPSMTGSNVRWVLIGSPDLFIVVYFRFSSYSVTTASPSTFRPKKLLIIR